MVVGDSKEEVIIFRDKQTDRHLSLTGGSNRPFRFLDYYYYLYLLVALQLFMISSFAHVVVVVEFDPWV